VIIDGKRTIGIPGPVFFIGAYLGLAPVYWFATLPLSLVSFSKWSILMLGIALIWGISWKNRQLHIPRSEWGVFYLLLLAALVMPGAYQSPPDRALGRILDLLLCFSFLWTCFLLVRNFRESSLIFVYPVFVLVPLGLLVVLSRSIPVLDWSNPFINSLRLSQTGFGGLSTGWSIGLAMIFPAAIYTLEKAFPRRNIRKVILLSFIIVCIIGSQIVVGGRAGILAVLVAVVLFAFFGYLLPMVLIILFGVVGSFFVDTNWLLVHFRLEAINADFGGDSLDALSAGRMARNLEGLSLVAQKPIVGWGAGDLTDSFLRSAQQIHFVPLRLAVENGILMPIVFFGLIVMTVHRHFRVLGSNVKVLSREEKILGVTILVILITGLVLTFFEPSVLIGAFQPTAIWWAALAFASGKQWLHNRNVEPAQPHLSPSLQYR
jgi:hypothetical protein